VTATNNDSDTLGVIGVAVQATVNIVPGGVIRIWEIESQTILRNSQIPRIFQITRGSPHNV